MEERIEEGNKGILAKLQQYESSIDHIDAEQLADICIKKIKTKADV